MTNCTRGKMVKLYVSLTEQTMTFVLQPWQLLLLILSDWGNRYQQQVIDFTPDTILRWHRELVAQKWGR